MNDVLISVIVPAYNVEKYLNRSLDSILNQTHKNIELIVVNDGSKDRTAEIIEEYRKMDPRVITLHKQNEGVAKARLDGIRIATGDYIGFVDADDYIEPNMYKRLLENAIKHDADISHCGYQMIYPNRADFYYGTGKLVIQNKEKGLYDLISGEYVEPGLWNKLIKKVVVDRALSINIVDTSIRINEDFLLNYYLFRESKISVYDDFCPYHCILRKGSATKAPMNKNRLKDPIKVSKIILEDCKSNVMLSNTVEIRLVRQMIGVASMSVKENIELIYPFRKQIRKELRSKLFDVLKNNAISMKLKIMTLWVCVLPTSYRIVHMLYAKIRGIDKKYDIEG